MGSVPKGWGERVNAAQKPKKKKAVKKAAKNHPNG